VPLGIGLASAALLAVKMNSNPYDKVLVHPQTHTHTHIYIYTRTRIHAHNPWGPLSFFHFLKVISSRLTAKTIFQLFTAHVPASFPLSHPSLLSLSC
jgi:hypothetical protein